MAYIPGYTYDIFISYAHVDNETIFGQRDGWIEQFYKNLNLLLAKRMGRMDTIKIWWDNKKLDGSRLFDESIKEGIRQSAIMLSIVSPGYLASEYCMSELQLFHKKSQQEATGLKVGDRSRILNILLNNIPYTQWPAELGGTTGFHFHDAVQSGEFGDPIDFNHPHFTTKMKELRDSVLALCERFHNVHSVLPLTAHAEQQTRENFTIFFGEVADTLRSARKRTISDLEKKGFNIIYGVPPPDDAEAHEQRVKDELKKTELAVHLLDQYPGRDIPGSDDQWYSQKQAELALQFAKSKIVWVPAELDFESVEDEKYKIFLQELETGNRSEGSFEYIRGVKSTLSQEVADIAAILKQEHERKKAKGKISVLLDTHFTDQVYAMDVGKALLENDIQAFINPQEDDPRKNINLLAERISHVSKLIFFYGKVSRDWVLERMSAALQVIVTNNYPIDDFFIYLAPPRKDPNEISLKQRFLKVSVIDNSTNTNLDTSVLNTFLKNLKGE
ncbi:MAG TPA: toll/interleukin-1 receptor domain-containing protein [Parafilimonas sp.]|nr:toll/interleukin-1 receptor domain-containing protein [Parafilimonas sp.]